MVAGSIPVLPFKMSGSKNDPLVIVCNSSSESEDDEPVPPKRCKTSSSSSSKSSGGFVKKLFVESSSDESSGDEGGGDCNETSEEYQARYLDEQNKAVSAKNARVFDIQIEAIKGFLTAMGMAVDDFNIREQYGKFGVEE